MNRSLPFYAKVECNNYILKFIDYLTSDYVQISSTQSFKAFGSLQPKIDLADRMRNLGVNKNTLGMTEDFLPRKQYEKLNNDCILSRVYKFFVVAPHGTGMKWALLCGNYFM